MDNSEHSGARHDIEVTRCGFFNHASIHVWTIVNKMYIALTQSIIVFIPPNMIRPMHVRSGIGL